MLAFLVTELTLLFSVQFKIAFLGADLSTIVQLVFLGVALLTGVYPAFLGTAWPTIVRFAFVAIIMIIVAVFVLLDVFHFGSL